VSGSSLFILKNLFADTVTDILERCEVRLQVYSYYLRPAKYGGAIPKAAPLFFAILVLSILQTIAHLKRNYKLLHRRQCAAKASTLILKQG